MMNKGRIMAAGTVLTLLLAAIYPLSCSAAAHPKYDTVILGDKPVGYWTLAPASADDKSGHGLKGSFTGNVTGCNLPDGEIASVFNGINQYFTVPDNHYLEVTRKGILTIEAWMRPDVLNFPKGESTGYVHWMGKGEAGQHAYAARMYNRDGTTETIPRPNRISGYVFNKGGGLGAGSYFQDDVTVGEWIHYTLVINTVDKSSKYPMGYTKIYKNGVLRDQDTLLEYKITPEDTKAPFRVGTRDLKSFFKGAVGKVAIYDYELTQAQISEHYRIMTSK